MVCVGNQPSMLGSEAVGSNSRIRARFEQRGRKQRSHPAMACLIFANLFPLAFPWL